MDHPTVTYICIKESSYSYLTADHWRKGGMVEKRETACCGATASWSK